MSDELEEMGAEAGDGPGDGTTEWISLTDRRSAVWKHFKVDKNDRSRVTCIICPKGTRIFKFSSSTTDLWKHLKSAHKISKDAAESGPSGSENKKDHDTVDIRTAIANLEPLDKVC